MTPSSLLSPPIAVLAQGFALGFGLIVAIGAQNAFVLRQGLRREYLAMVVAFCALTDAILIAAGVLGMAGLLARHEAIGRALALAGAVFLMIYGWRALRRLRRESGLAVDRRGARPTRLSVLAQAAAFTLLNPHVYLDTVLLVGGIGAQQPPQLRAWFIAGASGASVVWFGLLGFGARMAAPWLARPRAWQVLDGVIGLTMIALALLLLRKAIT
jgi:L-lysine exporter family protein LysE/ArgO